MQNEIDISIVLPVYNEENSLPELHVRLVKVLEQTGKSWEILYVDDGSTDDSQDLLKEFHQKNKKAKILRLRHNYGQQSAVMAGFKHARGNIIITLDADLQNIPEDIPKFLKAISEGSDIVCGKRTKREDPFFRRKIPSFLANRLFSLYTGERLHDYGCGFRAFTRDRVKYIVDFGETGKELLLLGMIGTKKIKEIDIGHAGRKYGKSKYTFISLINLTIDIVTSYSTMPFIIVGFLGLSLFLTGTVMSAYYLSIRFILSIIPEIGSRVMLLTLIFLTMGLQLLILGFLGEYILRINHRSLKKPMFKVDFFYN